MKKKIPFLSLFVASVYLFLYVPIIILIIFSFNDNPLGYAWQGFTTRWYGDLLGSSDMWHALKNSLIVAVSASVMSVSMATALVVSVRAFILTRLQELFYLNLAIPEIVLAVGLLGLFYLFSLPLGITALIASHTLVGLGYAVPIIYTRFIAIDRRYVEASLDLGATHAQTMRRIVFPLLAPAIGAALLLVFIVSFDEFILSFFCAGGATQTLPLFIFSVMRSGASPLLSALSTVLLIASSLLILVFSAFQVQRAGEL